MTISVEVLGPLKNPFGRRSFTTSVPDGATVHCFLLGAFGLREQEAAHLVIQINGIDAHADTVLHDGDALRLFLPVGGG